MNFDVERVRAEIEKEYRQAKAELLHGSPINLTEDMIEVVSIVTKMNKKNEFVVVTTVEITEIFH